jgi:sigma-B regulation protein RsbU (phosphoserine phosphatase)
MRIPASLQAELSILYTDGSTKVVQLALDRYVLGRGDSNELPFPELHGLSRQHLAFEREGPRWSVRDLGSTNGTFVNGTRIAEPCILRAGDQVAAGELRVVFSDARLPASVHSAQTVLFVENPAPARATVQNTLEGVFAGDREIQASAHMRALIDAGRELCGHTSLDELFEVIMSLSIKAVGAARGVLITLDEGEFRPRASKGEGFRISSHVRDLVINERRSLLVYDALADETLGARLSIMEGQVRGILAVPLQTEDHVIGLIYVDSPVVTREFTKDDLNVLTVLANIAAIRIEQARLAEIEQAEKIRARELEHAALIQRSILPPDVPAFPHRRDFQLHAAMVPARQVGGDLFDYFLLDEDHLGFAVGDVSGKGVPAALFMAVTRTLLRATAQSRKGPGDCFTFMNRTLMEGNEAGMFVTLFYGVLNTGSGELEFANAGHNRPIVISADGAVRSLPEVSGPMLGLFEGPEYRTLVTRIAAGETILLYTDGVTEAIDKSHEFFGEERLEAYSAAHAAEGARSFVVGLQTAVQEFAVKMPQADDITVLALRYKGTV